MESGGDKKWGGERKGKRGRRRGVGERGGGGGGEGALGLAGEDVGGVDRAEEKLFGAALAREVFLPSFLPYPSPEDARTNE